MEDLLLRLATALAIGLVVGVERGWQTRTQPSGSRTAGVRTFALTSLSGGVFAALTQAVGSPLVLMAGLILFTALFAVFTLRELQHSKTFSVTGLVAAVLVFALGALAVLGDPRVAGAAGITVAALLASRSLLHDLLRRMTWVELRSALVLLGMTVIVLPLLPDRPIGPFDSINPRELWLFMVLTAALSYAGYVAVRIAGPQKGILISAVGGAVVSSTAVTLAFARRAALGEPATFLAGGSALAGMVSILKVLAVLALVAPALLVAIAAPALAAAILFGFGGAILMHQHPETPDTPSKMGNPFDLKPLLAFVAGFGLLSIVSGWLMHRYGSGGLLLVSAIAGLVDVDVATLNAARLSGGAVGVSVAAEAVLVVLAVNAAARLAYGVIAGPPAYWLRLLAATGAALGAGVCVWLLVET